MDETNVRTSNTVMVGIFCSAGVVSSTSYSGSETTISLPEAFPHMLFVSLFVVPLSREQNKRKVEENRPHRQP